MPAFPHAITMQAIQASNPGIRRHYMVDQNTFSAYFNGEWLPLGDIRISPEDRGFVVADVVFDIARTFAGKPFVLDRHIDRLYRSLK